MLDKEEWCIVRYYNKDPDRKADYDLLVRRMYQWEAQHLQGRWEVVARGLTEKQATEYSKLFKE